jgi:hypothetical protein
VFVPQKSGMTDAYLASSIDLFHKVMNLGNNRFLVPGRKDADGRSTGSALNERYVEVRTLGAIVFNSNFS